MNIFKPRALKPSHWLKETSSWSVVLIVLIVLVAAFIVPHVRATTSGEMTLYFHKEASDVNETYNALSLTPPEPAADTAPSTLTSATNVNATPPTSFCESTDGQTDVQNERVASAASTGNRCLGTFISMPVGSAISMSTSDTNAITSQLWSSESATQAAVALNVYLYRWTSGTTVTSGDRIATLTCAEPGTVATTCSVTATPANNITFAATDRIIAIVSSNVTTLRSGADTRFYFDSTGRTATSVSLKYTALGYNTSNKPALSGTLDDDFTTNAGTTACSTSGVAYNTKWTCLQGTAANTAGAFNAADTSGSGTGDSSSWLWVRNQTTSTAATTSNFGTTPSNTFLYQAMPSSYGDGDITTVLNSSATFGVGASTPTTPFNHVGLTLWTSNTDYLELQVYSTAATTGTNSVNVALNNSGTLGTATSLNSTTTSGLFGEVWLRITNTGGTYQGQYSTDGTTWNNVGSSVSHTTSFTRVGLNAFTKIANPVSSYTGAFEWFSYALADPTYNQTGFRFFANADSTTPGSALAAANTNYTLTSAGQQFRLRQLMHVNGNLSAGNPNNFITLDSAAFSGRAIAVANGSDDFPRILDTDNTSNTMKFFKCTNVSCSSSTTGTVDSVQYFDDTMTMAADTFARISGFLSSGTLKYVQCTNSNCSTPTITNIDTQTGTGNSTSIKMGNDGLSRIAYTQQPTAGAVSTLKFIQCTSVNNSCTTRNTTTIDNGGGTNDLKSLSLAIGSDGFARIAYEDSTANSLKFVRCTNADCSTKIITSGIDTLYSAFITSKISLTIGNDGFGRIVYLGDAGLNTSPLKYAQCTDADCATHNITTIDGTNKPQELTSVKASDGYTRVAYISSPSNIIKYVTCNSDSCSSPSIIALQSDASGSLAPALTLNSNDTYGIAYQTINNTTGFASPNYLFKLQYATQGGACSSATYSDVTSSSAISVYNNSTPSDGDAITYQAGTDPTESGQTVTGQTYEETANFMNISSIGNSEDGEWDFSLFDNGATAGTSYCLRMAQYDGTSTTAFTTYTNYPVITTFSNAGPTTDQILRGGEWFSGGNKQPFFWAN